MTGRSGEQVEAPTDGVTDDAFLGDGLRILQPRTGYRAGVDAVLLAASVDLPPRRPVRVLDIGAGVGTAGLCVARRCPAARVTLFEREPALAALARDNISRNGLEERVAVVEGDIADVSAAALRDRGLDAGAFDHVLANPPFHVEGGGTPPPDRLKAGAHAMPGGALDDWVRFAARMARPGGRLTVIHKAEALGELLAALEARFGAIAVLPVHPRADEPAIRVVVAGTKGSRAPLTLRPGFVLHGEGNAFTPEAEAILRHGGALAASPAHPLRHPVKSLT